METKTITKITVKGAGILESDTYDYEPFCELIANTKGRFIEFAGKMVRVRDISLIESYKIKQMN